MEKPAESNNLLHRLRIGDSEALEELLRSLQDSQWYQDENGRVWQWGYDIDANLHRWFLEDLHMVRSMRIPMERPELNGAPTTLSYYAWGDGLWRTNGILDPYCRVE
jgi:hypothetical protein